jgi:hypothetical protein
MVQFFPEALVVSGQLAHRTRHREASTQLRIGLLRYFAYPLLQDCITLHRGL